MLESMGIVDRDRRTEGEIEYLRGQHIFVPNVAEVENLLMLEPVIKTVAKRLMKDEENVFEQVKEKLSTCSRRIWIHRLSFTPNILSARNWKPRWTGKSTPRRNWPIMWRASETISMSTPSTRPSKRNSRNTSLPRIIKVSYGYTTRKACYPKAASAPSVG